MKFLPWSQDFWLSREGSVLPYDKLEHYLIAFIATFTGIFAMGLYPYAVIAVVFLLGIGWEIRDGLVPVKKGSTVIQGFSWKDLISDFAGIVTGYFAATYYL